MPRKVPQKPTDKTPRKYLRVAALSAIFALAAAPTVIAQDYQPDAATLDRNMKTSATSFQHSYRNVSEWNVRRLDSCTHVKTAPAIHSDLTIKDIVYDHDSLTRADLDDLTHNISPDIFMPLGATSGNYTYSVFVTGNTYTANGKSCVHLTDIDVDITFAQTIQTASELLDHSCHLENVIAHEERHALINKTAIENYSAVIKDILKDSTERINHRVIPPGKTTRDVLTDMHNLFNSTVSDTLRAATDKADTQHDRIDSMSNYLKEQRASTTECGYSLPRFPQRKN